MAEGRLSHPREVYGPTTLPLFQNVAKIFQSPAGHVVEIFDELNVDGGMLADLLWQRVEFLAVGFGDQD